MKILPLVTAIVIGGTTYYMNNALPIAYAADAPAPTKSEPPAAAATEPVQVAPEVMNQEAKLTALQARMNAELAQRDVLEARIKALQAKIDEAKAMKDKLSK